jgi:glyoxylase-like metal-dependent hydrolase (beta-lactamase superfamily II)
MKNLFNLSLAISVQIFLSSVLFINHHLFGQPVDLDRQVWIHGSSDCNKNNDDPLQVLKYDEGTFILRQNKCLHYEAPFIYLFIGSDRALLIDTGAEAPADVFPLYKVVKKILIDNKGESFPLVVVHSHGHSDHYAGDDQFKAMSDVRLIPPTKKAIVDFFKLDGWPNEVKTFDLGNRALSIIPIPGHDEMSIAVYDPQTKWLLTGDTVYPGRLYVRDGKAFSASITRLFAFSKEHSVSFVMGNHIEMTRTKGVDYPTGTTYQPDEHPLPLKVEVLKELLTACERMNGKIVHEVHDEFIIVPK